MPYAPSSVYAEAFARGLMPDPLQTVSEWADTERVLSSHTSAERGPWRTSRTPFLREIMDALSPSHPCGRVVFCKGSQIGGTEAGNNWLGYIVDRAPAPVLAVQPTVIMAQRMSRQRIDPMVDSCPSLRAKVAAKRSRDSSNTMLLKEFPGGMLCLTGANSATGLRSLPARFLFLDEVDAYPGDADGEGDPVAIAERAIRTFGTTAKVYVVSTPTFEGRSRIAREFEEGDRSRYYVPCPHCGTFQLLVWENLRYQDEGDELVEGSVEYGCVECRAGIDEGAKTRMLAEGEWKADRPEVSERVRSFHLSALYSPVGFFSWEDCARAWLRANKPSVNRERLCTFVNTVLGETFKDPAEVPDWKRLWRRRETYDVGTVPDERAGLLTAGVDVQGDRLEVEVVAWGPGLESWSVDYRVFAGDPNGAQVWETLRVYLDSTFERADGVSLPIHRAAVDAGHLTSVVYRWVRAQAGARAIAVLGRDEHPAVIGQPRAVDVTTGGKRHKRGVKAWIVGTNVAKRELYGWLGLEEPLEADAPRPAGWCHFPQYPQEWFEQLTAEEIVPRVVRGYRRYVWEKRRERNEALDCRVYARAAAATFGIDRWSEQQWQAWSGAAPEAGGAKRAERRRKRKPWIDPERWRR